MSPERLAAGGGGGTVIYQRGNGGGGGGTGGGGVDNEDFDDSDGVGDLLETKGNKMRRYRVMSKDQREEK